MKKKRYILAALTVLTAVSLSGCKSKEKIDLTGAHTTQAETMASSEPSSDDAKESSADSTKAPSSQAASESGTGEASETQKGSSAAEALSVRSKIATEKNGKTSIEYPILSNLKTDELEKTVNDLLKEKALQLISGNDLNPETDTVQITCNVISLTRQKAVISFEGSMMAEGAAHPTDVFYTVTVDLKDGTLKGLPDYADAYTMAGYILSEDCVIYKAADKSAALTELQSSAIDTLWETLKQCDFTASESGSFPLSFSYENQGSIYMVVPVSHAAGDYAIVVYTPDTK